MMSWVSRYLVEGKNKSEQACFRARTFCESLGRSRFASEKSVVSATVQKRCGDGGQPDGCQSLIRRETEIQAGGRKGVSSLYGSVWSLRPGRAHSPGERRAS